MNALTNAQRKEVTEYQRRHNLAYSAIINSLKPSEHLKVYRLYTASRVWTRLHDEYGQISDLRRSQAETAWHALRKEPGTSMADHINQFTLLQ
jgi:gag-polypeptide of LTR copia-type